MSSKFNVWCSGKYDIYASNKIMALKIAVEYINANHRRMSIDDIHVSIVEIHDDYYVVEYTFYFTAFAESELDIEKLIHKDEQFEILTVQ